MRGNVVDLAVAVVIGTAFSAIVNSFVEDIITPGLLKPALDRANVEDIANLSWNGIKYGSFLAAVINFIVVGFVLFLIVRLFERFKRKEIVEADPVITPTEQLDATMQKLTETIERKL